MREGLGYTSWPCFQIHCQKHQQSQQSQSWLLARHDSSIATTCRQFEVLDVAWDATLGSEALDLLLLDHFAEEFAALHPGLDPRESPKVTPWRRHCIFIKVADPAQ